MTVLRWNLASDARRSQILSETLKHLSEEQAHEIHHKALSAGVPSVHHRNLSRVIETIEQLNVSKKVKCDMRGVYTILAEAEATAHGCRVEETHFHEVGEGSGIVNALTICLAIEAYNPKEIVSTFIQTGTGFVECAHGQLAIPAPATAAILKKGIPSNSSQLPGELCTPTSAALILYFVDRFE